MGEAIAAGTPLFQVMNTDRMWVRVPVYAGEQQSVVSVEQVHIDRINDGSNASPRVASRVAAPPTATALSETVDLYFEIDNADRAFRPGERVRVTVRLGTSDEEPVVPWSAVVHDINGGTWVYMLGEPNTYTRRRIEIEQVAGDVAVLRRGLSPGAVIVTTGAAELYGEWVYRCTHIRT